MSSWFVCLRLVVVSRCIVLLFLLFVFVIELEVVWLCLFVHVTCGTGSEGWFEVIRSHARTRMYAHARTLTHARIHARTHARTHTHARTYKLSLSLSTATGTHQCTPVSTGG